MTAIKANVYTLVGESLDERRKASIQDGLDIAGQYLGGISVVRTAKVRLPQKNAVVDTRRVGYGSLDSGVDLHLFAVPLDQRNRTLGLSRFGAGIAYVGSTIPDTTTKTTTAHEVAHAFGYVLADSPQHDRSSPGHCTESCCIMQRELIDGNSSPDGTQADFLEFSRNLGFTFDSALPKYPEDFCLPCKADMRDTGELNLTQLRISRAITGTVLAGQQILTVH